MNARALAPAGRGRLPGMQDGNDDGSSKVFLPGVGRFPSLFRPRQIGKLTAPNSIKYAACSVSNLNHTDGSISERELARREVVGKTQSTSSRRPGHVRHYPPAGVQDCPCRRKPGLQVQSFGE
jgi:hypothetical protein